MKNIAWLFSSFVFFFFFFVCIVRLLQPRLQAAKDSVRLAVLAVPLPVPQLMVLVGRSKAVPALDSLPAMEHVHQQDALHETSQTVNRCSLATWQTTAIPRLSRGSSAVSLGSTDVGFMFAVSKSQCLISGFCLGTGVYFVTITSVFFFFFVGVLFFVASASHFHSASVLTV